MVIILSGQTLAPASEAERLTPREIVAELDKHIVGQRAAKRAVAIALRNRWRRQQLAPDLRDEILPKNIIMIGPTGVGKTEIARRLAKLAKSPFLKIEASKFTEVGYVGSRGEESGEPPAGRAECEGTPSRSPSSSADVVAAGVRRSSL